MRFFCGRSSHQGVRIEYLGCNGGAPRENVEMFYKCSVGRQKRMNDDGAGMMDEKLFAVEFWIVE